MTVLLLSALLLLLLEAGVGVPVELGVPAELGVRDGGGGMGEAGDAGVAKPGVGFLISGERNGLLSVAAASMRRRLKVDGRSLSGVCGSARVGGIAKGSVVVMELELVVVGGDARVVAWSRARDASTSLPTNIAGHSLARSILGISNQRPDRNISIQPPIFARVLSHASCSCHETHQS